MIFATKRYLKVSPQNYNKMYPNLRRRILGTFLGVSLATLVACGGGDVTGPTVNPDAGFRRGQDTETIECYKSSESECPPNEVVNPMTPYDAGNEPIEYDDATTEVGEDARESFEDVEEFVGEDVGTDSGEEPDVEVIPDVTTYELKAVACPDEQEVPNGPYRINDVNDPHNGWCRYDGRVSEWLTIDDCRSTAPEGGSIAKYMVNIPNTYWDESPECNYIDRLFTDSGVYEGVLKVVDDQGNENLDSIVFNIN